MSRDPKVQWVQAGHQEMSPTDNPQLLPPHLLTLSNSAISKKKKKGIKRRSRH